MKTLLCIAIVLATWCSGYAQWVKYDVKTTASLRGLSVVNEKVVWASGTGGTVIRTIDGGKTWNVIVIPGAEKLDFRDIEAFDANTAYILSIGNGEDSRIYKTTDGGKNWAEQFRNKNAKAFFDAVACWDAKNCIAMSDPVDHKFVLIETKNGGANWTPIDTSKMPAAKDSEAAFAASGTCLITHGKYNAFLVTGGNAARVFKSTDRGKTWEVYETPMIKGTAGSGIFSIAMYDENNGVIVGGNYEKPNEGEKAFARTTDGGRTWIGRRMGGYRSGVAYITKSLLFAVGTNGSDFSDSAGVRWNGIDSGDFNAVAAKGLRSIWAVGQKGTVVTFERITKETFRLRYP
jgi:photosystem II stability/assembly factor-like uncharacterized protein